MTQKNTLGLETERLILRPFTLDDAEAVHAYAGVAENVTYMLFDPNSFAETQSFLDYAIGVMSDTKSGAFEFAVETKAGGRLIGGCSISRRSDCEGEVGWMLNRDYWRQGFGAELGDALIQFGFTELGLSRITARCDAENVGSYLLMEKIGMKREGLFRDGRRSNKVLGGVLRDELSYAILAKDYFAARRLTFAPYDVAADYEFLKAAHREAVALTFHADFNQELFEAEIAKRRDARDGAYLDGKLVGICDLERRSGQDGECFGFVNFFYIAPEYRGMGFGGQLIDHAADWCRDQGLKTLGLRVGKDNARAFKCYEKNGFERQTERDTENELGYIKRIVSNATRPTDDLSFSETIDMASALQAQYEDKWGALSPDKGAEHLLWLIVELGEAADIIKKDGSGAIMNDAAVRARFVEEMADALCYVNTVMLCYGITPAELAASYRAKHAYNMTRWK